MRGTADEAGDEPVAGRVVELLRRADLLDRARRCSTTIRSASVIASDLVVGDIDHRGAQRPCSLAISTRICDAQFGVEIGQRLVEQEHFGLAHDRPADRHALALSAGKLRAACARSRWIELQHARGVGDLARSISAFGHAQRRSAEAHIVGDVHMRVERVGLEHHGNAALGRRHVGHVVAADAHLALR